MSVALASAEWLAAFERAVNNSDTFERLAGSWNAPLGLAFLGEEPDEPDRFVIIDLRDGHVEDARFVDEANFNDAPFRFSGSYERWRQLAGGRLEPLKAIVLKRIELAGDLLKVAAFLPAAKVLLQCACSVLGDHEDGED